MAKRFVFTPLVRQRTTTHVFGGWGAPNLHVLCEILIRCRLQGFAQARREIPPLTIADRMKVFIGSY
jgi:hypothetical protein